MLRILAPPLVLGVWGMGVTLLHNEPSTQAVIAMWCIAALASFANLAHLSYQIVTRPPNPPLGLPRGVSGVLLFFGLSMIHLAIGLTAWFAGCACFASMKSSSGGLF